MVRHKVAARLVRSVLHEVTVCSHVNVVHTYVIAHIQVRIEKQILQAARQQLLDHAQSLGLELVVKQVPSTAAVKLS